MADLGLTIFGADSAPLLVPFIVDSTVVDAPVEEAEMLPVSPDSGLDFAPLRRIADLSNAGEVRVTATTNASYDGTSSVEVRIQFSVDDGATWHYADGIDGPKVVVEPGEPAVAGDWAGGGAYAGAWVDLTGVAKGDVLCRVVTAGGDGTQDFEFLSITLEAR